MEKTCIKGSPGNKCGAFIFRSLLIPLVNSFQLSRHLAWPLNYGWGESHWILSATRKPTEVENRSLQTGHFAKNRHLKDKCYHKGNTYSRAKPFNHTEMNKTFGKIIISKLGLFFPHKLQQQQQNKACNSCALKSLVAGWEHLPSFLAV